MNSYSNTKPQLVSSKILKQLGKTFKVPKIEQTKWTDSMSNFYEEYIRPNLFALIVFALLTIFLTIKYIIKNDRHKKKAIIKKTIDQIKYNDDFESLYKSNNSVYDGSIYPEYMLKDELINNDNELYKLQKEYEYNINHHNDEMSDQMMKDIYQTKTSKFLFDEMSKIIAGK